MVHILQVVLWIVIPALLEKGSTTEVMTVFLVMFLIQYLPKIYHSVYLLRRMQNLSGYIFGTVWWGIALNLIAYFVASHVSSCMNVFHPSNMHNFVVFVDLVMKYKPSSNACRRWEHVGIYLGSRGLQNA